MTTFITFDDNGNEKKWIISKNILNFFNIFKDINIHDEYITLKNINQDDFSKIYDLLILESATNLNAFAINIDLYDTKTLYNIFKLSDFFHIKHLQEKIGKIIALRFNKMNKDDLKNIIESLF
jgi:hypothetical protein